MARQTTVRHRPPALDDDNFVSGVVGATVWTRQHVISIIIALVAVVVVFLGVLYYRSYRSALEERAATELTQIRQIAAAGNLPLATRQLRQFVVKYGSTNGANEGRILLAQSLLDQNAAKDAIPFVQPLASNLGQPLGPAAAFLLAAAYEASGDVRQAEATYLRIADKARFEFQRRDAYEGAARLKLQHSDPAGAASLYERILAQMPDTATGRPIYQMRLAEAQAQAQGQPAKK